MDCNLKTPPFLANEIEILVYDADQPCSEIQKEGSQSKQTKESNCVTVQIQEHAQPDLINIFESSLITFTSQSAEVHQERMEQRLEYLMSNPLHILCESYLEKRTDKLLSSWTQRYFVLTPEKLYLFPDERKEHPKSCVNLKRLIIDILKREENVIAIHFHGESQDMLLRGRDAHLTQVWLNWLSYVNTHCQKEMKLGLMTGMKGFYHLKNTLTESEFLDEAQTGDILLFRTNNIAGKIQRALTGSQADHVAMIINFQGSPVVFESNFVHGVSMFEWKKYIQHFNLYEGVTLRKLHYLQKEEAQRKLLTFVKTTLGKSYQLSAFKLLMEDSDYVWGADNQRGYFCSELIAKALKVMGLLDTTKFSGKYWPKDFTVTGGIELINGASLGCQQTIVLQRHRKQ